MNPNYSRYLGVLLAPALFMAAQHAFGQTDTRIQRLLFKPNTVVKLQGCVNFETMIRLNVDEHVNNIGVGDASQWQVMPNKRGDILFIKPLVQGAHSNMSVVTDKRIYNFEMSSDSSQSDMLYELQFEYATDSVPPPGEKTGDEISSVKALPPSSIRNVAYTYSGSVDLVPLRVFDDGKSTFMHWADGVAAPAIYALGADGSESLINYAQRGDYLMIEQVARAFVLRRGQLKTILYNDDFHTVALDAQSPQPRSKAQGIIR